jgi:hypothetical protein
MFEIKNLPPMPRNRSHMVARNMLIKTPLAREFEKDLMNRLSNLDQTCFNNLKKEFNPKCHYLSAHYVIYTPESELFTKDGSISMRAVDCDAHKLFQDVICRYMGIDDKFIRKVTYETPVSYDDSWNYVVTYHVKEKDILYV